MLHGLLHGEECGGNGRASQIRKCWCVELLADCEPRIDCLPSESPEGIMGVTPEVKRTQRARHHGSLSER